MDTSLSGTITVLNIPCWNTITGHYNDIENSQQRVMFYKTERIDMSKTANPYDNKYRVIDSVGSIPNEIETIKGIIAASRKLEWSEDILGRCEFITKRDFKKAAKELTINEYWTHFPNGFHEFSLPVFFENYSICIFYQANNCGGLCGHGKISIYKKRDGIWDEITILSQWWA